MLWSCQESVVHWAGTFKYVIDKDRRKYGSLWNFVLIKASCHRMGKEKKKSCDLKMPQVVWTWRVQSCTHLTFIDFLYLEKIGDKHLDFVFSFYTQLICKEESVKYIIV